MTDTVALRRAVEKSGLKYGRIASEMGISAYTLQKKIDNKVEFKASEIVKLAALLSLEDSERSAIFFHSESDYKSHAGKVALTTLKDPTPAA